MALASLIVARVREAASTAFVQDVLSQRYPPSLPPGTSLADLPLSTRTKNAVLRSGLAADPTLLAKLTLHHIIGIRGLGAKGLVELLVALEEVAGSEGVEIVDLFGAPTTQAGAAPIIRVTFSGGLTVAEVTQLGAWCRGELTSLPISMTSKRLPPIPRTAHLDDLDLAPRTYGAIQRAGHELIGEWLDVVTIGEILSLPSFGRTSLGDLLAAIVRLMQQPPPPADVTAEAANVLCHEAAEEIRADDLRLRRLTRGLARDDETIAMMARRLAERSHEPVGGHDTAIRLQSVAKKLKKFGEQSVEEELLDIAAAVADERKSSIWGRYRGWDGRGGAVLQTVGDEFGMTRERVRQICDAVEKRLLTARPYAPVLDQSLQIIIKHAPAWADDIHLILQRPSWGLMAGQAR